jgi:hypothetical protein
MMTEAKQFREEKKRQREEDRADREREHALKCRKMDVQILFEQKRDLKQDYDTLERKRGRLLTQFDRGLLTADEYRQKDKAIDNDEQALDTQKARIEGQLRQ